MKKIFFVIVLMIFLLSCTGVYAEDNPSNLTLKDFEIGGFRLTQPMSEVIMKLGQPLKVKIDEKQKYNMYLYSKYVFGFYTSDEKIALMRIKDPNLKTNRGIEIGDNEKKIFKEYGKVKKIFGREYNYQLWHPSMEWGAYSLSFIMEKSVVKEIEISFAID